MQHETHRAAFTRKSLLAVVVIAVLLLGLAVPAIQAAREAARRSQCASKLKQIGSALQNYHDAFKKFPALTQQGNVNGSANVWNTTPGATFAPDSPAPNGYTQSPASAAGYSWIVMVLPYMDEQQLYDWISRGSVGFTYEAFSTTGAGGKPFATSGSPSAHFATVQLDAFRCPSFRGSGISTASSGTAQPPVAIPAYAGLFNKSGTTASGVAITNYVALPATHLTCMGLGQADPVTDGVDPPNGVIVPGGSLSMAAVRDGTSNTIIACETKEPAVNSWYDGTVCWTVGANPNASSQPTPSTWTIAVGGGTNVNGDWAFPPDTKDTGSLNYGPTASGLLLFAPSGTTPTQTQPVSWGPSSDHSGVVMHLFCDGSVHALAEGVDPNLYLRLITRAAGVPIEVPADLIDGR